MNERQSNVFNTICWNFILILAWCFISPSNAVKSSQFQGVPILFSMLLTYDCICLSKFIHQHNSIYIVFATFRFVSLFASISLIHLPISSDIDILQRDSSYQPMIVRFALKNVQIPVKCTKNIRKIIWIVLKMLKFTMFFVVGSHLIESRSRG